MDPIANPFSPGAGAPPPEKEFLLAMTEVRKDSTVIQLRDTCKRQVRSANARFKVGK